jgi:hypothetical protein
MEQDCFPGRFERHSHDPDIHGDSIRVRSERDAGRVSCSASHGFRRVREENKGTNRGSAQGMRNRSAGRAYGDTLKQLPLGNVKGTGSRPTAIDRHVSCELSSNVGRLAESLQEWTRVYHLPPPKPER